MPAYLKTSFETIDNGFLPITFFCYIVNDGTKKQLLISHSIPLTLTNNSSSKDFCLDNYYAGSRGKSVNWMKELGDPETTLCLQNL